MWQSKKVSYIHFDSIDSTNNWAKSHCQTLDPHQITCITAVEQTAGRGRWLRKWVSPKGQNIYASIYFCTDRHCSYLSNLGQILSLSCAAILKKKGFSPQIKWPNDILLEGKKVAGILAETVFFEDRIGVILGIGLNVNMSREILETIDQPATSLSQLSGHTWTIEQILDSLLHQFLHDLDILHNKGFVPFAAPYERLMANIGQKISWHDGKQILEGVFHSIAEDGRLRLELADGKIILISSGEIT